MDVGASVIHGHIHKEEWLLLLSRHWVAVASWVGVEFCKILPTHSGVLAGWFLCWSVRVVAATVTLSITSSTVMISEICVEEGSWYRWSHRHFFSTHWLWICIELLLFVARRHFSGQAWEQLKSVGMNIFRGSFTTLSFSKIAIVSSILGPMTSQVVGFWSDLQYQTWCLFCCIVLKYNQKAVGYPIMVMSLLHQEAVLPNWLV